jgi:hypothetical protein
VEGKRACPEKRLPSRELAGTEIHLLAVPRDPRRRGRESNPESALPAGRLLCRAMEYIA